MNISIFDRLRPYLSKVLASILVPALAWAAAKTGFVGFLDPAVAEGIANFAASWLVLTLTHTGLAKWFNPGNTASAHLAKVQAVKTAELKNEIPTWTVQKMDDIP